MCRGVALSPQEPRTLCTFSSLHFVKRDAQSVKGEVPGTLAPTQKNPPWRQPEEAGREGTGASKTRLSLHTSGDSALSYLQQS